MSDQAAVSQALHEARQALKAGDRRAARRWAEQAVSLSRDQEEPWLVLAQTASPRASVAYTLEALRINPRSQAARQAVRRAVGRFNAPTPKKIIPRTAASRNARSQILAQTPGQRRRSASLRGALLWGGGAYALAVLVLVVLIYLAWPIGFPKVDALFSQAINPRLFHAASEIDPPVAEGLMSTTATTAATATPLPSGTPAPSFTPRPSATFTQPPTQTSSPTPIPTQPPTLTATFTAAPTSTPTLTSTPVPAAAAGSTSPTLYTVQRGDTLFRIASRYLVDLDELIRVNNISNPSLIKVGQELVIPNQGSSAAASAAGDHPAAPDSAGKSILVDISDQRVYSYESGKLVFNFQASTGRNNSTRIGSFSILDKDPKAWSYPWGFWMPYWMGIYYVGYDLENGFHSLPVLANGETLWGSQIGTPGSYGCIVLQPEDMKQLYQWAGVGTAVEIRQ